MASCRGLTHTLIDLTVSFLGPVGRPGCHAARFHLALRLVTLGGLTPYEYICKVWTSEPDRFILDPIHQVPGLNT